MLHPPQSPALARERQGEVHPSLAVSIARNTPIASEESSVGHGSRLIYTTPYMIGFDLSNCHTSYPCYELRF